MKMKRAVSHQWFFATCIIAAVILKPASAIWCYQCRSTDHKDPFQCGEYMTSDISMEPKDCRAVYDAQYCVKQTGRFEGGLGTKRFCSSHDLGNYCNYIQQPGDQLEYRSCVYTCSTDGCNSANDQQPKLHMFLCSFLLAGFYFSFY